MSTIYNLDVDSTFKNLLQVSNNNSGIDGTLRDIEDGEGTASSLMISTAGVKFSGTVAYGSYSVIFGGNFNTGAAFTTNGSFSTAGSFTTSGAITFSGAYTLNLTLSANTALILPITGTLASTTSKLSDFASTTSAELLGVISDETGSGKLVFGTSPTITTPTIAAIKTNAGANTFTFPITDDTAVGRATTDTLTNKTLTSPKINQINDTNGLASLVLTPTASAVNYISLTNSATGLYPTITATGSDTNIGLVWQAKGTGYFAYVGTSTAQATLRLYEQTTNGTNYVGLIPPAAITADRTFTLPDCDVPGHYIQQVSSITSTVATGTTVLPFDNTIPQNTEGDQYMSLSITPKLSTNKLKIDVIFQGSCSAGADVLAAALFQDSTANALGVGFAGSAATVQPQNIALSYTMTAGTTSATTFKVRAGATSGTTTFNGTAGAQKYGGVMSSSIIITEYSA